MTAYYNEFDPFAADWLRNLIAAGLIAPGDVDERSITEVQPDDLRGYTQVHLFAGIGGWSYAVRLAGWPDDRPLWTGSCPCQPFSAAGKGLGTADARHLWPEMRRLLAECRPPTVAGEQVASKAGRDWLAGVRLDLEGMGYAVGAADLCAAGLAAPHIRQRLWWVADSDGGELSPGRGEPPGARVQPVSCEIDGRLGDATSTRCDRSWGGPEAAPRNQTRVRGFEQGRSDGRDGWTGAVWLPCRDGKARRLEPGLEPLVDGVPFRLADGRTIETTSRAGLLKGLGNAIVPQLAAEFLMAYMEAAGEAGGTT